MKQEDFEADGIRLANFEKDRLDYEKCQKVWGLAFDFAQQRAGQDFGRAWARGDKHLDALKKWGYHHVAKWKTPWLQDPGDDEAPCGSGDPIFSAKDDGNCGIKIVQLGPNDEGYLFRAWMETIFKGAPEERETLIVSVRFCPFGVANTAIAMAHWMVGLKPPSTFIGRNGRYVGRLEDKDGKFAGYHYCMAAGVEYSFARAIFSLL